MLESDGIDDVTVLVNSSPDKMMGVNFSYANGFPSMSNAVLCAKASMLLQVSVVLVVNVILMYILDC
jgi:homeobox-leucine zipper protein